MLIFLYFVRAWTGVLYARNVNMAEYKGNGRHHKRYRLEFQCWYVFISCELWTAVSYAALGSHWWITAKPNLNS